MRYETEREAVNYNVWFQLSNLKVTESTLELVQFSAEVGSQLELKEVRLPA